MQPGEGPLERHQREGSLGVNGPGSIPFALAWGFDVPSESRQGTTGEWDDNFITLSNIQIGSFSITASATVMLCGSEFRLTMVYGPSRREHKVAFLSHLRALRPNDNSKWLIAGDFNLIYKAKDRNNRRLNLQLMRRFCSALSFCGLKEIHLQSRKFTWSSERRQPTLSRIDLFFCNDAWNISFDEHTPHALSSSHSDHYPLILARLSGLRRPRPFKFKNLTHFLGNGATCLEPPDAPFHRLDHKLHITSRSLRKWSASVISNAKLKFHMAQVVIQFLDTAQDARPLQM